MFASLFLVFGLGWFWGGAQNSESPNVEAERLAVHQARTAFQPKSNLSEDRPGWPKRPGVSSKAEASQDLYDESVYRTFEITYSDPNWHEVLIQNYTDDRASGENTYLKADLVVDGVTYENVGVQYKGNSSFFRAENIKKPIKITMDAFVDGQELYGHDIITLNNGVWDPTLYREAISYKILRKFMPAPRANLARVTAGIRGAKFELGVYTSVERIDKRFLEKHFGSGNGHRYKADQSSMNWLGSDVAPYRERFTFGGAGPDTAYQDLIHVIDVLNNTPDSRLIGRLDPVFSIDRMIRQTSGGVALLNWDDLRAFAPNGHNYYLYQVNKYGQMVILPWDWDLGLSDLPYQPIDQHFDNADLPLLFRLMMFPDVKARYHAFLRMMAAELDWNEIRGWVENFRDLAEPDILSGEYEFFTRYEYEQSLIQLQSSIEFRQQFLLDHPDLDKPHPEISQVQHQPQSPKGDEPVTVTAAIMNEVAMGDVRLYFRGRDHYQMLPMADDGLHGDGDAEDGVYGATIPFQLPGTEVTYYIEAFSSKDQGGAAWYSPIFTEHQPYTYQVLKTAETGDVVINEIMAHSHGEAPDWIELHNTTDAPVSVGDWFISDSDTNFKKYQIASDQVIPAKGYLVLDEATHFGEASTDPGRLEPFALSENGETVYLSSGSGAVLTGFKFEEAFGASETGVAMGRHHKLSTNSFNFVPLTVPTPGFANAAPKVGPVVMTELMYAPPGNSDAEYIELLNVTAGEVTLFDPETSTPWKVNDGIEFTFPVNPPLTLAPGERILLVKDREAFDSQFTPPDHVRIWQWDSGSLNNAGEKVELAKPGDVNGDGERQYIRVDRVNYSDEAPWPASADGEGKVLARNWTDAYGNDPANWQPGDPTPGLDEPEVPKTRLIYPWISNRAGEFRSVLVVNNLGAEEAVVTLTAVRADGSSETVEETVPARGFIEQSASTLFPILGSGGGYTVTLETVHPDVHGTWLTNSLRAASGQSPSQGVAVAAPELLRKSERRRGTSLGFGYLPVTKGLLSAPVLVNCGTKPAEVSLEWFNRNGVRVHDQKLAALNPGQPYAVVANHLVGSDDAELMMLAKSGDSFLTGVSFVFNNVFYETAIGNASRLAPIATPDLGITLVFPWVSYREGQFRSTLIANNYTSQPVTVQLVARRETGREVSTSRQIPANGFFAESASTLFPTLGSGAGFSVVMTSPRSGVMGQWVSRNQLAESGDSPAQGVAVDLPGPGELSQRVGQHLLLGYVPVTGDFFTAPVIVNVGSEPVDVTLYFYNREGTLVHQDDTSLKNLEPFRPYARLANDLVENSQENLQVIASASSGRIAGVTFIFNNQFFEPAIGNAVTLEKLPQ